jgi:putative membrane-bound dehydrogenase-like protein
MTAARHSGRLLTAMAGFLIGMSAASGAEPELRPEDLPHFPPVEPANVAASFEIRPGFHIEIAAAEPEVVDPVAMSFDALGRAYVIEMRDYSERRPERLGRVRRLEDRDGDGRYETSTIFLDGLAWPTAITCWNGGVFVGTTPDIVYAKDTDGDGRADIRETVFTGFASDFAPYATNKLNVQAMMNSLQWGPDCRIHGCGSMSGGKIQRVISPFTTSWRSNALARLGPAAAEYPETTAPLDLRGRDFSFDPRLDSIFVSKPAAASTACPSMTWAESFSVLNSDHLQIARYEERYASRSGWFSPPSPRASIAADGPAAEVFRISPEEPWRVIRTRWRVTGLVQGLIEGGGRSSGYFTSATGITVYPRRRIWLRFFRRRLRRRLRQQPDPSEEDPRPGLRPDRRTSRRRTPTRVLASRDTWFRPVQFANAPDGCLWIVDMYREVIEHPWSLPPNLKRLIDLNSGNDRGRLIRIVPEGKPLRRRVNLASASDDELIATLGHANGWHRDTAARLLHERQGSTVPGLKSALRKPAEQPLAKLQALQLLFARKALDSMDLALALRDASPEVRRTALRYTELTLRGNSLAPPIASTLADLANDDPNVRLQLAFSLGSLPHPLRTQFLAALLRTATTKPGESLIAAAALSSLGDDVPVVFTILARDAGRGPSGSDDSLPALAEIIGRRDRPEEASAAIEQIATLPPGSLALHTALQLANGLRGAGKTLATADAQGRLKGLQTAALNAVTTGTGLPQVESIRLLGHFSGDTSRPALLAALSQGRPASTQRAAIDVLLRTDDGPTLNGILERWGQLEPDAQTAFLEAVLRRPTGTRAVLEAIGSRRIEVRSLTAAQVSALRGHADPGIQRRAVELLGPATANRHDAVAALLPALSLRGDIERGLAVHAAQCAPCHRLGGQGHPLGPDLESVRSQPKEKLLVGILDPNREVQPTYLAVTVETTDGEALSGLITSDTPAGITLVQAGGVQHQLARAKIQSVKPDGRSLMPEGFEATITAQQLADLLATLTGAP